MSLAMRTRSTAPARRCAPTLAASAARSDEELLLAYRDYADREAFVELVQRYERELYSYLRRYLESSTLAEDAFQTTFLQVHLKCDQFDENRRVRPWLYAIATNQAIDVQRRNKRHRMVSLDRGRTRRAPEESGALCELLAGDEAHPHSALETAERRDQVRSAVRALPEILRQAVLLVYYQGMKYREAAEVLGVPVGTVKSRLHAALIKLNQAWGDPSADET